jgi:hypothetical protein
LLVLGRQAVHEFNDMQGNRAHESTVAEFRRDVKRFKTLERTVQGSPAESKSEKRKWGKADAEIGAANAHARQRFSPPSGTLAVSKASRR